MAAIQTAIELNDQFTSVLYGIMDAVNLATAQMYDMQQAMSMDIDTSSLEGAREAIDEATASLIALNGAAQQPASAPNPLVGSSAPVEIPVQWETNNLDVFTGTGIDRFEQEVQSTNSMLEQLNNHFAGTTTSATGLICGAFAIALAFIGNLFIGTVNTIIGIGVTLWNLIANFVNAFALIFNNPIAGIEALFLSLFNFIVEVIESAARMLDAVFGSSLADAVAGFQNKVQAKVDAVITENGGSEILKTVEMSDYQFNRFDYGDAWNSGYNFGEKIDDKISNFSLADIFGKVDIPNPDDYTSSFSDAIANSGAGGNLDSIADDTSAIKDSVDITDEDLKYLRDIAEQEAINRFTTAEIKLDMTNNNNVSSDADLDGIVDGMTTKVLEALEIVREGA